MKVKFGEKNRFRQVYYGNGGRHHRIRHRCDEDQEAWR